MTIFGKIFGKKPKPAALSAEATDWNRMITIVSSKSPQDLNEEQKHIYYAYHYDNEVQNGGHLQFFLNSTNEEKGNIKKSLEILGAPEFAKLYSDALGIYEKATQKAPENVEEYIERNNKEEFTNLDEQFYNSEKDVSSYMKEYLNKHRAKILI